MALISRTLPVSVSAPATPKAAVAMDNPIKAIRDELHLTQKEAASLCGVTEQVILKTEQGLYPTIGPSVLLSMAELSGVSVGIIEAQYEEWLQQELKTVKLLPPEMDQAYKDFRNFPLWREMTCHLNGVPNSVNSLCKLFKLNPYVIQKYEAGRLKQAPLQLEERIAYIRGTF